MDTVLLLLLIIVVVLVALILLERKKKKDGAFEGGGHDFIFTQEPWYTMITDGKKTVEARVGRPDRYKKMMNSDVEMRCDGQKVPIEVKDVRHYPDLGSFLKAELKKTAPGMSEAEAKKAYLDITDKSGKQVYSPDNIADRGGIVAIEFKLI